MALMIARGVVVGPTVKTVGRAPKIQSTLLARDRLHIGLLVHTIVIASDSSDSCNALCFVPVAAHRKGAPFMDTNGPSTLRVTKWPAILEVDDDCLVAQRFFKVTKG